MRRRPFLPDDLTDLELAQLADHERADEQPDRQGGQARRRGAERDVARHVQDRPRSRSGGGGSTASGELLLEPFHHQIGSDAARALDQHEIAGADVPQRQVGRLALSSRRARHSARACPPRSPPPPSPPPPLRRRRSADRGRRAPPLARPLMQLPRRTRPARASRRARDLPRAAGGGRQRLERAPERRRARVVRVVDQRDAARQPQHSPR